MSRVKVSSKFQIVIPKHVREQLGIRAGQELQVVQFADRIEFVPLQDIKSRRGFLKGIDTNVRREKDAL
jgi:AbrB family looped-hinge helix DNA binding protein